MAYRLVYTNFWSDPKSMEEMSAEDKYFYLYILTNPSTTNCGIYTISKKQMILDLCYPQETVNMLMERFENEYKLIAYNKETRELAIKNWGKYNLTRGGKPVIDCLTSELSRVKDKALIEYICKNIEAEAMIELYKSFYESPSTGEPQVDNTEINTDTSTNTSTNTSTERNTNTDANTVTLLQEYEKLTGHIGQIKLEALKIVVVKHGHKYVKMAMHKALEKGKNSMSYINGILNTWAKEGYPVEEVTGGGDYSKNRKVDKNKFRGFKPQQPIQLGAES